jgi:putative phosphoribosyl transferase
VLILALPRGGVPVAFEVAQSLHAPLDVFVVRKLGVPDQEELAMGAIASGGVRVLNRALISEMGITDEEVQTVIDRESQELERRGHLFRDNWPPIDTRGRTVILVDDGLATGSTMYAAVLALKQHHPAKLVVAVPIAAQTRCSAFEQYVDAVICPITPEPFHAVGAWYRDFAQTTDDEVRELLRRAMEKSQPR